MANIKPRRRLADLFAKGREVRFSEEGAAVYEHIRNRETKQVDRKLVQVIDLDGEQLPLVNDDGEAAWEDSDDDIVIWVQPPNPHQREQALREGQAQRGILTLNARKKKDTPEAIATDVFVAEMSPDTLLEYVLATGESDRREEAQRNVLLKDEWKDFSQLQDAMRRWDEAGQPDTPEWQALVDRDVEFGVAVNEEAERLRVAARESLKLMSQGDLEDRAKERRVDLLGSQTFMATYEREMLWASCRDPQNHDQQYWTDVQEMLTEAKYGLDVLADIHGQFITEARDAKNARRAAPGSALSELPAKPETSEASTPTTPTE